MDPSQDRIYRVGVFPNTVVVMSLGLDDLGSEIEGKYNDVSELPNWLQVRLAILTMAPATIPSNEVEGVGRRISDTVFWVFGTKDDEKKA